MFPFFCPLSFSFLYFYLTFSTFLSFSLPFTFFSSPPPLYTSVLYYTVGVISACVGSSCSTVFYEVIILLRTFLMGYNERSLSLVSGSHNSFLLANIVWQLLPWYACPSIWDVIKSQKFSVLNRCFCIFVLSTFRTLPDHFRIFLI